MKNWFLLAIICVFVLFAFTTSFAQTVTPRSLVKEDKQDPKEICPLISVSCPDDPSLDKPLDFAATVTRGDPNATPTYGWEVANGEIISGQGTHAIKVRAFGYRGVTATLRIGGIDKDCASTASCSVTIHAPRPLPQKFDSYGLLHFNKKEARLDLFAAALKDQPDALGYILVYGSRQDSAGGARKAADSAKQYLVEKFDIEKDRIRIRDGGSKEELTVELWLIPPGASLPVPEPDEDR